MNQTIRPTKMQRNRYMTLVITFCAVVAMQSITILSAILESSGTLSASTGHQMRAAAFITVSIIAVTALYMHHFKRSGGVGSGD